MERLVFDVEVVRGPDETAGGWNNPAGMGFGTGVIYSIEKDFYEFFGPNDLDRIRARLENNYTIGFNHVQFDNKVIWGNSYREAPFHEDFNECDLLFRAICSKFKVQSVDEASKKVGHFNVFDGSLKLERICNATLQRTKGDGALAPKLIQEERWAEVFAYNLHDVRLTYKLYCFVQEHGFLIDGNSNRIHIDIEEPE